MILNYSKSLFKSEHPYVTKLRNPVMETHKKINEESVTPVIGTDGREARSKFWIALYTRPNSEKKAADSIAKFAEEVYVPTQTVVRQWSDRKKKVDMVVIPMVIFAKVSSSDILNIKKQPLIIRTLAMPGSKDASPIPEKQINSLKFMLNASTEPVTFEPGVFRISDNVIVVRGNLKGLIGQIKRLPDNKVRLIIAIDFLGGASMEINLTDIEKVEVK